MRLRRPPWSTIGAVIIIAAVATATWAVFGSKSTPPEAPRARQYSDFTVCLLTDATGLQGADAKPIWTGLQQASLNTHAKAQFLPVTGEQTPENATLTLNSLAQRHCSQIYTAGTAEAAAARASATTFPSVTFYVLGGADSNGNLKTLPRTTDAQLTATIHAAVTAAAPH